MNVSHIYDHRIDIKIRMFDGYLELQDTERKAGKKCITRILQRDANRVQLAKDTQRKQGRKGGRRKSVNDNKVKQETGVDADGVLLFKKQ
ncbi:hypothetical protein V6N12_040358 [Hibiscus sabdariffa]|uniref:Uncharacterized protein n=1 Tax=Hibiscus sabdariffa TaxID=183260 RepID=A0ABR2E3H4_9ROSI